ARSDRGLLRARRGSGGRAVPARCGTLRHRAAGAGRLRGGPQVTGQPGHGHSPLDRRDCLRAGRGPPPLARSWLRAAFGQAGGPRRPGKSGEFWRQAIEGQGFAAGWRATLRRLSNTSFREWTMSEYEWMAKRAKEAGHPQWDGNFWKVLYGK